MAEAEYDVETIGEKLEKAEALSAEDDLVLRLDAVSKVRGSKCKNRTIQKGGAKKPNKSIAKKRKKAPKPHKVVMEE